MNTKSIIGIIIAAVILVLIGVWLSKTPETPVVTDTVVPTDTLPSEQTPVTTTQTPATTPPKVGTKVISTNMVNGMKVEVTKEGSGAVIKNGQTAVMLYTGKLVDGSVFDATSKRNNEPLSFTLGAGQVIEGWDKGIVGMKVGEQRTLTIPPAMAYGAEGRPPVIPENATLIFDVTLVGIK